MSTDVWPSKLYILLRVLHVSFLIDFYTVGSAAFFILNTAIAITSLDLLS